MAVAELIETFHPRCNGFVYLYIYCGQRASASVHPFRCCSTGEGNHNARIYLSSSAIPAATKKRLYQNPVIAMHFHPHIVVPIIFSFQFIVAPNRNHAQLLFTVPFQQSPCHILLILIVNTKNNCAALY